jgi:hypothetical protein
LARLKTAPGKRDNPEGDPDEGGWGATIVLLKDRSNDL